MYVNRLASSCSSVGLLGSRRVSSSSGESETGKEQVSVERPAMQTVWSLGPLPDRKKGRETHRPRTEPGSRCDTRRLPKARTCSQMLLRADR